MFIDFLVELLGSILLSCFSQDRSRLEPSPWERRQEQLGWYFVVGVIVFLTLSAATWIAASHYL